MKRLIVINGPTASGKTAMAIAVAQHFGAEILSCDARQFYREMTIGTAVPTPDELAMVPHHFIHSHAINQPYSVGDYERDVLNFLDKYYRNKDIAVMVGGSGFYSRAVCEGMDEYPEIPENIRTELRQILETQGISALQTELAQCDPVYYGRVDKQNPARLIRALEVCRTSGKPFSSFQSGAAAQRPFHITKIGLRWERELLYQRINERVLLMMQQGLEQEARALYPYRHLNALQTVGYQELFDYFDGNISLEAAVQLIQQNSRHYAKRQMTWLRREKDLTWVDCPNTTIQQVIDLLAF